MRIGAVAVLFLTFVVASAIIPIAVSSPGSSHPLDNASATVKAEDESFLSLDVVTPLPFLRTERPKSSTHYALL